MIEIRKDASGESYEYRLINSGKEVMIGDGYETKEEIFNFVKEILDSLVDKDEVKMTIEVDDDWKNRDFIYQNKIESRIVNENMTTYDFKSSLDEVRAGAGFPGPQHQTEGWG